MGVGGGTRIVWEAARAKGKGWAGKGGKVGYKGKEGQARQGNVYTPTNYRISVQGKGVCSKGWGR